VKTAHGVSGEAHFRAFLQEFLPKKYGVTKGYIITPDLDYAGPLEEWDIIIYDAMESPVLFVRQNRDEHERSGKRGIPVEYVRGVVEVKATFNKSMAEDATRKLLKLRDFIGQPDKKSRATVPDSFSAFAVFFETKVASSDEYVAALGALAPFWQTPPLLAFSGALILRGQTCPNYAAVLSYLMNGSDDFSRLLDPCCEVSKPVPSFVPEMNIGVVSGGYGENEFWRFMIDMVHALNGEDEDLPGFGPTSLTGGYGQKQGRNANVRLFPKSTAP
jgi:hypothetical protein